MTKCGMKLLDINVKNNLPKHLDEICFQPDCFIVNISQNYQLLKSFYKEKSIN